eukprot:6197714-Pleurochrysis_carterae.AAC.2
MSTFERLQNSPARHVLPYQYRGSSPTKHGKPQLSSPTKNKTPQGSSPATPRVPQPQMPQVAPDTHMHVHASAHLNLGSASRMGRQLNLPGALAFRTPPLITLSCLPDNVVSIQPHACSCHLSVAADGNSLAVAVPSSNIAASSRLPCRYVQVARLRTKHNLLATDRQLAKEKRDIMDALERRFGSPELLLLEQFVEALRGFFQHVDEEDRSEKNGNARPRQCCELPT